MMKKTYRSLWKALALFVCGLKQMLCPKHKALGNAFVYWEEREFVWLFNGWGDFGGCADACGS